MSTQGVSRNASIFSILSSRKPHLAFSHLLPFVRNPIGIFVVSLGIMLTSTLAVQIVQQKNIASKPIIKELSSSFFDIKGKTNVSAVQNVNDPWSEKGDRVNVSASNSADMGTDLEAVPEDESTLSPSPTEETPTIPPLTVTLSPTQSVAPDEATITVVPTLTEGVEISPTPTPDTIVPEVSPTLSEASPSPTPESSVASIPERKTLQEKVPTDANEQAPNRVIVKFRRSYTSYKGAPANIDAFAEQYQMTTKDTMPIERIAVLDTEGKSVEQAVSELKKDPMVDKVEPDYIKTIDSVSNDTYFSTLWGLHNTGQSVNGTTGTPDKDIDAPEAWDVETDGQPDVVVAVIDTGINLGHEDLYINMWDGITSGCKDNNNQPISGGCPWHGWDYINGDSRPADDNGHGTHVAGIIAAKSNNSLGVSGISKANNIKIMALKVGDSEGRIYTSAVLSAINFARYNGVKVINASYGGSSYSQIEKDTIDQFPGLFIAAAGNDGTNNDTIPQYPCSYISTNIICVAATDQNDALASFSNYGATSVDVAAPGTGINSTYISVFPKVNESFNYITPPNLPAGFTKTGDPGTKYENFDTKLYGDLSYPYSPNTNNIVESYAYSTYGNDATWFDFETTCDTEYTTTSWEDYMALEISNNNGASFQELLRWDEAYIDSDSSPTGTATYHFTGVQIPSNYSVSFFKFRFRWVTDGSDYGSYGKGCNIDNLKLNEVIHQGSTYGYLSGTSMATPYVAGVAGLAYSTALNYSQPSAQEIKDALLKMSNDFDSGKGFRTRRVNMFNTIDILKSQGLVSGTDRVFVYRFWSDNYLGHFYTADPNAAKYVNDFYPESTWRYEYAAYQAFSSSGVNRVPVYRFWSNNYNGHWYTAVEAEKDYVIANDPNWTYEGIAWYVYPKEYVGSDKEVYRFWSNNYMHHFFTSSIGDRDYIIANDPNWAYEGVAWKLP